MEQWVSTMNVNKLYLTYLWTIPVSLLEFSVSFVAIVVCEIEPIRSLVYS